MNQLQIQERIESIRSNMDSEVEKFRQRIKKTSKSTAKVRAITDHIDQMQNYENELAGLYNDLDETGNF